MSHPHDFDEATQAMLSKQAPDLKGAKWIHHLASARNKIEARCADRILLRKAGEPVHTHVRA